MSLDESGANGGRRDVSPRRCHPERAGASRTGLFAWLTCWAKVYEVATDTRTIRSDDVQLAVSKGEELMGVNGDRARFVLAVWALRGYDFSMPRIARAILAGYPNKTGSVSVI